MPRKGRRVLGVGLSCSELGGLLAIIAPASAASTTSRRSAASSVSRPKMSKASTTRSRTTSTRKIGAAVAISRASAPGAADELQARGRAAGRAAHVTLPESGLTESLNAVFQPNSGFGDYSRLSCGVGIRSSGVGPDLAKNIKDIKRLRVRLGLGRWCKRYAGQIENSKPA
jgi:hypothetical protein